MYFFNKTNDICFDIYLNNDFILNDYNNITKKNISDLRELMKKDYFEVPSYVRKTVWGNEIIFFPFTDKLFKIVSTNYNDTSIQLHPRKSEVWYPLINSTIFNGYKWINVNPNNEVIIPKNSIHCMKHNSCVFEVQDNSFFDNEETIRIFDINNRKIENKYEYLNYCLPHNFNELKIERKYNDIYDKSDIFLFIIEGNNKINGQDLIPNKLYYIKNNLIKNIRANGSVVAIAAMFINVANNEIN